jgi:ATP-dependent Zn protease
MIFVGQLLILSLVFGSAAKRAIISRRATPNPSAPVEVAYSQFMDLVETDRTRLDKPQVVSVRIGTDKIGYQVVHGQTEQEKKAIKELLLEGKTPTETLPFRNVYTRKVSASPELVDFLRKHKIPFAAAPQVRSKKDMVSTSISFLILFFYLTMMMRFSGMMSGPGTKGPGKLASANDLPLASFDEIQGIDDAKEEVMELVDTLRNPQKYAILGARAPKGLLLEG